MITVLPAALTKLRDYQVEPTSTVTLRFLIQTEGG